MDNQHRAIEGYQEMDQQKIDLFNKITATGKILEDLCNEVGMYYRIEDEDKKRATGELTLYKHTLNPDRWRALAITEFQTGLMFLKRALARPTIF